MIEAPLHRPHPGYGPLGRESPAQEQQGMPSCAGGPTIARDDGNDDDDEDDDHDNDVFDERARRERFGQMWTAGPKSQAIAVDANAESQSGSESESESESEREDIPSHVNGAVDTIQWKRETGPELDEEPSGRQDVEATDIPVVPLQTDRLPPRMARVGSDHAVLRVQPDHRKRRRSLGDSSSMLLMSRSDKLLHLSPQPLPSPSTARPESQAMSSIPSASSPLLPSGSDSDSTARKGTGTGVFDVREALPGHAGRVVARPASATPMSSRHSSAKTPLPSHLQPRIADSRRSSRRTPTPLRFEQGIPEGLPARSSGMEESMPSPMPQTIPLPPVSLPTYLQLELSSHRPPPLYIHRSVTSDFPYESSRVKIERLLNFLLLPPQLEQVLWFGTFACLDAWLYTFTILPLRLLKSFYILGQSWATNIATETRFVSSFIYAGAGRMWKRRRMRRGSTASSPSSSSSSTPKPKPECRQRSAHSPELRARSEPSAVSDGVYRSERKRRSSSATRRTAKEDAVHRIHRHRRNKSVPSDLLPDDKADILKGLLIISTCIVLMRLDASRMYHWVRGQAAIKLYVLYNVLEVGDRLLSALGQDVLECLFSKEALERGPDGHSKVLRPFWLFLLALAYTVCHATALFYQVITLNVAVNSYSNALITLLMSNQFVEIKSTVFKKFEKENLFQLTCADVVERFQLWLMLLIIASRNVVETGGLSAGFSLFGSSSSNGSPTSTNSSDALMDQPPQSSASILPRSFTLVPNILSSLTAYAPGVGHVLGPFLVVLGSEMMVDWFKHSYINKFNNTRPAIYGRFLDVLAKDYYSNAFGDQNLTRRLGLPVIPLSCLFIRASVQTYHMFQAAWIPPRLSTSSSSPNLPHQHSHGHATTSSPVSPGTVVPTSLAAALSQRLDALIEHLPTALVSSTAMSHLTSILVFLLAFLVLVTIKLVLGMLLLAFARSRYRSMKEREENPIHHVEGCRRVGGWGVVEVDNDKRRWIYDGDAEGARQLREREEREKVARERGSGEGVFERVKRYEMVAKRIW